MARAVQGRLPSALEHWDELSLRLQQGPLAVFVDYDGTLTPIAARPKLATLSSSMRDTLRALAKTAPVGVVTGRALADVRALVGLSGVYYAGNHGFEIEGLGLSHRAAPELHVIFEALAADLETAIGDTPGVTLEAKGYSVAVHYRGVESVHLPRLREAVDKAAAGRPQVRLGHGKKVFELRPSMDWNKGSAVRWLIDEVSRSDTAVLPLFIGDDRTDEDALVQVRDDGIGIFVGTPQWETAARYCLSDSDEVELVLRRLTTLRRTE